MNQSNKLIKLLPFFSLRSTSESFAYNSTIGYSFDQTFNEAAQTDAQHSGVQAPVDPPTAPVPPVRKSNLVKSNSQKEHERRSSPRIPIKPERTFIVQRCALEQSCSMGELNIKQLDAASDQDSGLQATNSLEGLDKKNPRKHYRATTLPKAMLFGMPLDSEKRGTLKVR